MLPYLSIKYVFKGEHQFGMILPPPFGLMHFKLNFYSKWGSSKQTETTHRPTYTPFPSLKSISKCTTYLLFYRISHKCLVPELFQVWSINMKSLLAFLKDTFIFSIPLLLIFPFLMEQYFPMLDWTPIASEKARIGS